MAQSARRNENASSVLCAEKAANHNLMPDQAQTNLTDRMIARLEEANARSYRNFKQADESPSKQMNESSFELDVTHRPLDQQPAQKRPFSRASLWLFASVGLVSMVSMYLWGPSYGDAVNTSVLPQPGRQNVAAPEPVMPPEVERRLQRMEDELADAQRKIDQLKAGQDEINRNSAKLAEQFAEQSKADQEQIARGNVPAKSAGRPSRRTRLHRNALARWPRPDW